MKYTSNDYAPIDTTRLGAERKELYPAIAEYLYSVLTHRLSESEILAGYMLYWTKYGLSIGDVHRELHRNAPIYDDQEVKTILAGIQIALANYINSLQRNVKSFNWILD